MLLYTADGVLVRRYTIIICGDVNGDGVADGMDAVLINAVAEGMLSVEEHFRLAADTDSDGTVTADDSTYSFDKGLGF